MLPKVWENTDNFICSRIWLRNVIVKQNVPRVGALTCQKTRVIYFDAPVEPLVILFCHLQQFSQQSAFSFNGGKLKWTIERNIRRFYAGGSHNGRETRWILSKSKFHHQCTQPDRIKCRYCIAFRGLLTVFIFCEKATGMESTPCVCRLRQDLLCTVFHGPSSHTNRFISFKKFESTKIFKYLVEASWVCGNSENDFAPNEEPKNYQKNWYTVLRYWCYFPAAEKCFMRSAPLKFSEWKNLWRPLSEGTNRQLV